MTKQTNHFGQPLGFALPSWAPPPAPAHTTLVGRYCRLEPLRAEQHAASLYAANATDSGAMWTYLPYGPFESYGNYKAWMESIETSSDPLFFTIVETDAGIGTNVETYTEQPGGIASYLRIDSKNGVIEVGHIAYAPRLRRTRAATEAMYLMMQHAFALGYRRYEWKCDALNGPSRAAAERLGFTYEGTFRQAVIYKGRNRDTAWFSITDQEWPALNTAFTRWLAPDNFDEQGQQQTALSDLTRSALSG